MNYKIWFDEDTYAVFLKIIKMPEEEDVNGFMTEAMKLYEGKERRYAVVDLSDNPPGLLDKPARKAFRLFAESIDFDRIVMFGGKPVIRMMAKVAVSALGKLKITKFFETEKEAINWLKEDG